MGTSPPADRRTTCRPSATASCRSSPAYRRRPGVPGRREPGDGVGPADVRGPAAVPGTAFTSTDLRKVGLGHALLTHLVGTVLIAVPDGCAGGVGGMRSGSSM